MVLVADSVVFRPLPLIEVLAFPQDTQVFLLNWVSLPTVHVRQVAWLDREPLAPMPAFRRGGRPGAWAAGGNPKRPWAGQGEPLSTG